MMKNCEFVFIIHSDSESPQLLCRKSGGFSSLATDDCIFTVQEAWHYMNNHPCDIKKFETYSLRSLNRLNSFLGKTPQEIADCKRSLSMEFVKRAKNDTEKGVWKIEKTKKEKPPNKYGGLFEDLDENRNESSKAEKSGANSSFDIF